ncbi:MAG: ABC transporter permease [Candidatus Parvarchaeota archaeon]
MRRLYVLLGKRVIYGIISLIGLTVITFILSHAGGPTMAISTYLNPQSPIPISVQEKTLEAEFHLNQPLYIQYFYYMVGLFHGNWGYTKTPIFSGPVTTAIAYFLPNTIELSVVAIMVIIFVGIPLGVFSAARRDGPADNVIRVISFIGVALPAFWLGLILQETFASNLLSPYLNLLPLTGNVSNNLVLHLSWYRDGISYPTHFLFIDALIHGDINVAISNLIHLILPALTVSFTSLAVVIRMTRSSTIDSLNQEYIKTIRTKGIPEKYVIKYHAKKNAMIPVATVIGIMFATFLSGVVLVEYVFSYPGIGGWIVQSFLAGNIAGIMGANLTFGIVLVTANIVVDIVYTYLDPRIRY